MTDHTAAYADTAILLVGNLAIDLPVSSRVLAAIQRQIVCTGDYFIADSDKRIEAVLMTSLEKDFALPSQAQLTYAQAIAQKLGKDLGFLELSSKKHCGEFISLYADTFQEMIRK